MTRPGANATSGPEGADSARGNSCAGQGRAGPSAPTPPPAGERSGLAPRRARPGRSSHDCPRQGAGRPQAKDRGRGSARARTSSRAGRQKVPETPAEEGETTGARCKGDKMVPARGCRGRCWGSREMQDTEARRTGSAAHADTRAGGLQGSLRAERTQQLRPPGSAPSRCGAVTGRPRPPACHGLCLCGCLWA